MRTLLARTGLVLLAATAAVSVGCAAERDPINHVQPNAVPKSFFLGDNLQDSSDDPEFRMKSVTIDTSVGQSEYGIGEFSAVDRIRWEVTEGMLLGRRAYQEAPNADGRAKPGDRANAGTIVAAFKILKHFDIRYDYNPSTGEEANVIVENDSDRPWNQRDYMRVDWSRNLVDSTNDQSRFWKTARVTPVEYNVTDPSSEDAPHMEVDTGYLDVTNKFTVEPDPINFSWGSIPRCVLVSFFTGTSTYDCNPQEATVRTSFARVQKDEDFEAFEDNYAWKDVVGNTGGQGDGFNPWLGSARTTWDPQYGFNDAQTHRLKSIHNIWKKSHQDKTCSSNADTDKNGTADACENGVTGYSGHSGSQCDVRVNKCTIPVRDREIKTIAYHLNKDAPESFQDKVDADGKTVLEQGTLEGMGNGWSQLIEVAVAYRREVECRRTKDGDRAQCHAEFFESDRTPAGKQAVKNAGWLTDKPKALEVDKGKPGYYVCHNPVRAYDPEDVCGKVGDRARLGDIRKNHLIYWPYESRARYGGVGWNPPDPVTGETFGATATIMGRSATRAAAMQRDIIQIAMGDTTLEDVMNGVPAQRFAQMLKDGTTAPEGFRVPKTQAEIQAKIDSIDMNALKGSIATRQDHLTLNAFQRGVLETKSKAKSMVDAKAFAGDIAKFSTMSKKLEGLPGVPGDALAPLRDGMDPAKMEAMKAWFDEDMAARGACYHDAANSGTGSLYLASLAGYFRAKYGSLSPQERGQRIYDDLVKETIKGIGIHEMGHSLGLRHNFASSWDAPNYNPQYWQLRTNEGKALQACNAARSGDQDSCMGPRYLDPETRDEQGLADESRPGIDYFANTSTMEYQIERGGESVGLGTYDQHAMKVLYGRVIETFDPKDMPADEQKNFSLKTYTQLQERDLVVNGNEFYSHYTNTARSMRVFDEKRDCRPATAEEKAQNGWRVVHNKVCAPPPKDHWSFDDFETGQDPLGAGIDLVKWHAKTSEGNDNVRWTYRWGEQYGAGGYMHTTMMDAGADIYELTQNLTRSFELRYPWSYFRRGDREWTDEFLPQSTSSSYFSRLRAYHWQIALDLSRSSANELKSDNGDRPYVMAQSDIFSFLQKAALMPEPGDYATSKSHTVGSSKPVFDLMPRGGDNRASFTLGLGDARYIAIDFENDKGGSWDYQKYVHHAGFEVEKSLALMQLVDPRPTLFTVARENYLDGRDVFISFRSDLPDGVDRLLGGLLSEDWEAIAPHVVGDATGGISGLDLASKAAIARPSGARIVFPNIGYKQQLGMAIYAALFSRLSSDMTLLNKMRLSIDGDRAPIVAGTREVRFTDPVTGFSWIASKYGDEIIDGKTVDHGIASRMIGRANALLLEAYTQKLDDAGKPMFDAKGQPVLATDANGAFVAKTPEAGLRLRRYVGLLDAMRQVSRALDGPLGGGGGGGDDE
ncbi:MAG: zinc-dependent metalloprotease [Deltaproteobacteria bacterium]|nr:zinc-dependent metalloprotease [Deltaproteobacteria bacterium]